MFVEQPFALSHQQLVFCSEPPVPAEAVDVFAHPVVRTFGAGMALVAPLEKLEGDVGNEDHGNRLGVNGWEM